MFDPDALMKVRDIAWRAKWLLSATSAGVHRSLHHGSSIEFSQYRPYSPGDDPRRIDWRLYGRSDRHEVKLFEDETARRVHVIVDQSRSMGYRSVSYTKLQYAQTMAATVAMEMHRRRDRVGLITFDDGVDVSIAPGRRPSHLSRLFTALSKPDAGRETALGSVLDEVTAMIPPRGLVFILSDALTCLETLHAPLQSLAGREHEVVFVRVLDPGEIDLTAAAGTRIVDRETGQTRWVDAATREGYRQNFEDHAASLRRLCDDLAITIVTVKTDRSLVDQMLTLFSAAAARRSPEFSLETPATGRTP